MPTTRISFPPGSRRSPEFSDTDFLDSTRPLRLSREASRATKHLTIPTPRPVIAGHSPASRAMPRIPSVAQPGSSRPLRQVLVNGVPVTGTDAPSVGSVFATYSFDDGSLANIYSAILHRRREQRNHRHLETPLGTTPFPSPLTRPTLPPADAGRIPIGTGDVIVPVGSQTMNAITGLAPLPIAFEGTQLFFVEDASGLVTRSFNADDTITGDFLGTYTEAVLVTKYIAGAAHDLRHRLDLQHHRLRWYRAGLLRCDLRIGKRGHGYVRHPVGNFEIPTAFEAAQAETTSAIDFPGGDHLTPFGTLAFTGVNGLPPGDVAVQGTQTSTMRTPMARPDFRCRRHEHLGQIR